MIWTPQQTSFGWSNKGELDGRGKWHLWEIGEVWWGEQREIDNLEDLSVDGRINIKMDLQEVGLGGMDILIWLRIGTDGERLYARQQTFTYHKMRGISWLAEDMLASEEGLCSMELFGKSAYTFRSSPWTVDQPDARPPLHKIRRRQSSTPPVEGRHQCSSGDKKYEPNSTNSLFCGRMIYYLTNSAVQSPSWTANIFSTSTSIARILIDQPLDHITSQENLVHALPSEFLKIYCNIILPSTPSISKCLLPFMSSDQESLSITFLPYACHMFQPIPPLFICTP
jgi:hypothetical protein